ncbi:family A G protein-coupled receptor-like protein [Sistotremastrum niveocremeum HHB9708]|uniref:Family A G protein-coupled receptor-like protein n=1 Tax=Sistotremastrum niveocremeum HHB9708 TaxID=1314777 RepID=A0A164QU14_9AGAM|nr:family A G protein-coupled receptor-like protein [Sistotremastrum niveocremeum HHB9708]
MFSDTVLDLAAQFDVPPVVPPPGSPPTIPHPRPIPYFSRIGHAGHTAQWVVFVIFLVSALGFLGLGSRVAKKHRAFHAINVAITGIACLSYFAMATRTGSTFIYQGHKIVQGKEVAVLRQVYWARYVDWALTTPMLLLDLGLLAGLPWFDIICLLAVDEGMIITGLISAFLKESAVKWGWYAFACIFLVYILYTLLWTGRQSARIQSSQVFRLFNMLTLWTVLLWIAYPIIFALSEGTGMISPSAEAIAYAVVDVLAKSAFGYWLVLHRTYADDEYSVVTLPQSWVEPRGQTNGIIHLPGDE